MECTKEKTKNIKTKRNGICSIHKNDGRIKKNKSDLENSNKHSIKLVKVKD